MDRNFRRCCGRAAEKKSVITRSPSRTSQIMPYKDEKIDTDAIKATAAVVFLRISSESVTYIPSHIAIIIAKPMSIKKKAVA